MFNLQIYNINWKFKMVYLAYDSYHISRQNIKNRFPHEMEMIELIY